MCGTPVLSSPPSSRVPRGWVHFPRAEPEFWKGETPSLEESQAPTWDLRGISRAAEMSSPHRGPKRHSAEWGCRSLLSRRCVPALRERGDRKREQPACATAVRNQPARPAKPLLSAAPVLLGRDGPRRPWARHRGPKGDVCTPGGLSAGGAPTAVGSAFLLCFILSVTPLTLQ